MTATIESLEKRVAELEAFVAVLRAAVGGVSSNGVGAVASSTDLDSRYGDPKVKLSPRDWKGAPRKGWLMSRCEPEFLDLYAETLEFFARKNDEEGAKASNNKPKSFYDRADAARARGWAKRIRDGWQPPAQPQPTTGATRYGTSGWGANAKHSAPPEHRSEPPPPREEPDPMGGHAFDDFEEESDEIPFG